MEFGRLPDVSRVDFTLPREPEANGRVLRGEPVRSPNLRIGLAGWSDRGFVGELYPRGTPSGRFLELHARAFTANELNSTYYGAPRERLERWARAVPDGFHFCPKLPSIVTHDGALGGERGEMEAFLGVLEALGDRRGRVWGVLSPTFSPARLGELERFLERYAARVPLALELRHPTWFRDPAAGDAAFDLFGAHGVVPILTDVAGRRDVLHMRLTVPEVFLRFVGNGGHPTDATRVESWVERITGWCDAGLEGGYLFFHQKQDPAAIDLARRFAGAFRRRGDQELLPGLRAAESYRAPQQQELF